MSKIINKLYTPCIYITNDIFFPPGDCTLSTWTLESSDATSYTLFGQISSQLHPQYFLGTENTYNLKTKIVMWNTLVYIR